ncbi:dormancy-associated protein homolog 3-like [Magnolia sinica]|uniref:dormancy-associated protein homolog 3-like n=1 Tax=Magnolia sinica TaxID=86752 RepID=UPI00265B54E5|nr:dormancy-associated protein homolog 3-like [Magnolia sinica]
MGLLDKLWDDTVAGPRPDSGLSKLRKYSSMSAPRSSPLTDDIPISRSITIVKPASFRNVSAETGSLPSSPAGSSAPGSPFAPTTPRGDPKKMRRKSTSEAYDRAEPRNPTVYDWVVIGALDR